MFNYEPDLRQFYYDWVRILIDVLTMSYVAVDSIEEGGPRTEIRRKSLDARNFDTELKPHTGSPDSLNVEVRRHEEGLHVEVRRHEDGLHVEVRGHENGLHVEV